jgi:CRISPR-associated protein Cas1
MKRVNKTLYIINDGYYLHCESDAIVIRRDDTELMRVPAISIEQIVIMGNATVSSFLVGYCCQHNILLSYVSEFGKYYGSFLGEQNGNVLLRQKQYSLYHTSEEVCIAKNIVLGKSINSRHTLLRALKNADEGNGEKISKASEKILNLIKNLLSAETVDSIRGIEGSIADIYFGVFDNMLKVKDSKMLFVKRSRRPPENCCNAMLSLLYTFLTLNCVSALETAGLDSEFGYLHALRSGRHSLACDLVEEFRSAMVDRFVITMINRKQVSYDDFENDESGIHFKKNKMNKFLQEWEKYKSEEVEHPIFKTKVPIKVFPYIQAQLLAQTIRGDISEYPPAEWR